MKAYFECGKCHKHSAFNLEGTARCPRCGSTSAARMSLGVSAPPEWFQEDNKPHLVKRIFGGRKQ